MRDLSGPQRTAAEARLLFVYAQYRYRQEEEAGPCPAEDRSGSRTGKRVRRARPTVGCEGVSRAAAKQPLLSSRAVFMVMGLLTHSRVAVRVWRLSRDMVPNCRILDVRLVYRLKIQGLDKLPETGGHC